MRDLAQGAGWRCRRSRSAPRSGSAATRCASAGVDGRSAGQGGGVLPPQLKGQPARDRLSEAARADRRRRRPLRAGLRAAGLAHAGRRVPALRRPAARGSRPGAPARREDAAKVANDRRSGDSGAGAAGPLRLVPRPRDVPDPRRRWASHRLRRACARRQQAQVHQLARDPVFSKGRELYGLFEARQACARRGYALVVEGYMDVVALAQSASPTRWPRSARRAPPSTCRSCSASPTRWSSASTATPPAAAPRPRARGRAAACQRPAHGALPVPADRARPRQLRARARRRRLRERWQAVPLSRQLVEHAARAPT